MGVSNQKLTNKNLSSSPYSGLFLNGKLVSISDLINDKYDNIYNELLDRAKKAYISDNHKEDSEDNYIWKVIKQKNFIDSPHCYLIKREFPYPSKTISLKKYWDCSEFLKVLDKSYKEISVDEDSSKDLEIININYVNGICKLRSRLTGNIIEVDFNKLPTNTPVSDDEMTLKNTFTYMTNY
jgi:hypothetical protein